MTKTEATDFSMTIWTIKGAFAPFFHTFPHFYPLYLQRKNNLKYAPIVNMLVGNKSKIEGITYCHLLL